MGHIRSVAELPVEGKRVFVRVDFNVPLTPAGGVSDDSRIRAALPTLRHLLGRGARLVLASHLGRPKGKTPSLTLLPVAARLAELLAEGDKNAPEVRLTDEPVGDGARKVVADLRDGEVAMLENLRFHPGEEKNDESFAKALASYAEVYVNDAFGTAHRAHASTVGMIKHFADKGAGFLMLREIEFLSKLLGQVERPYVVVVGGAKVSDKIAVLENLAGVADSILIGGAMANTFLAAQSQPVGKSRIEEDRLQTARSFLKRADGGRPEVLLPSDVVVAPSLDSAEGTVVALSAEKGGSGGIPQDAMALDIGPDTVARFAKRIAGARTVFWNGPMGVFEKPAFSQGTLGVARALASCEGTTVVGGGDSVAAINEAGVAERISHVSTGGGASLEFVEGQQLPGIAALESSGPSSDGATQRSAV